MRRIFIALAAPCLVFGANAANAQAVEPADVVETTDTTETDESDSGIAVSGEVAVMSSYLDDALFNDRLSDEPVVKLDLLVEFDNGLYVSSYVYSGLDRPLNGKGSEYGFEFGWEGEVGNDVTVDVAAGRMANYAGAGFDAGDWYGRVGVSYGGASLSVTGLSGDSDTFTLNASYEAEIAEGFTLTPSVAYITATGALNPGVSAEIALPHGFALRGSVVFPETDTGRKAYAAVGMLLRF